MDKQLEALETANEYIENLIIGIKNVVKYIQEGREYKACEIIPAVAEGIEWLTQIITLTKDFHKGSISDLNIDENLKEIVEGLENEDYILVSDLFNYEIMPVINNVHEQIKNVI